MAFIDEIVKLEEMANEVVSMRDKIKVIADNLGVETVLGTDTPSSLLEKISQIEIDVNNAYSIESVDNGDGTQTLNILHNDYGFKRIFANNKPVTIDKISQKISQDGLTSEQVLEP